MASQSDLYGPLQIVYGSIFKYFQTLFTHGDSGVFGQDYTQMKCAFDILKLKVRYLNLWVQPVLSFSFVSTSRAYPKTKRNAKRC